MSEVPSVRESLEAAMVTIGGEGADGATTDQGAATGAPAAAGQEGSAQGAQAPQEAATEGRARDESGRFAKPGDPLDTTASDAAPPAGDGPPTEETIRIPASLPAPLKAAFKDLAPEWQAVIRAQEDQTKSAKDEWGKKGERLNRYEEIIGPHKADWEMQGLDEFQAVQRFAIIEKNLREAPVQSLAYLARSYGVTLPQLAQAIGGGQSPQQGAPVDPNFAALQQQFQALQQTVTQQTQQSEAARLAEAKSEIQAFAEKPENLYFHNVAGEVAELLGSGRCKTLAEAYETACWASPEVRPLLLKAQQSAQVPADPQAQQRAKAAAAAKAAGSVTGAPGSASNVGAMGSKGSLRADLEHAAASLGARVG